MLTRQQAGRIADDILQQARTAKVEELASASRRIPLLSRCRELRALPQWVQTEVVRQAMLEVAWSPAYILLVLAWMSAGAAVWTFGTSQHGKVVFAGAFVGVTWIVTSVLRGFLMGRRVRAIAAQLQTLAPMPG